jgi:hypothetical protein
VAVATPAAATPTLRWRRAPDRVEPEEAALEIQVIEKVDI